MRPSEDVARFAPRKRIHSLTHDLSRFKYVLLGVAALIVVVVGFVGWMQTDPSLPPWEALYRTLALFTISMPDGLGVLNPWLEVARWGAIVVAGVSLLSVVRDALRDVQLHRRLREAKRAQGHVVIRGDGAEAVQIAFSFGETSPRIPVVLVGAAPTVRLPELRERRVVWLSGADDFDLAEILQDARHIVVVGASDQEAMAEATRIGGLRDLTAPVTVLFDDRDLASQWNRSRSERAVSRPARVATELLRVVEPVRLDAVVPPSVVFGDGGVAVEIARRIITGWQEPGERVEVHFVSDSPELVDSARVGLEARGDIWFHQMASHPELAPNVLEAVRAGFRHMDMKGRVTVAGPRVYVAYQADELTVTIASALAEQVPDAVVAGVIDDAGPWSSPRLSQTASQPVLKSIGHLLTSRDAIEKGVVDELTDEILADAHRWPSGVPPLFGEDEESRVLARSVAAAAAPVLAAAGLELDSRIWPARLAPFLGPDELLAVAAELARLLPSSRSLDRARLLEFAARYPTLIARAGHTPDWRIGRESLVTAEEVVSLASAAHESYLDVSRATRNATGSDNAERSWDELAPMERRSNFAQTADIPLKLALCGLSWRRVEHPVIFEFSSEEVELLAEQEHRRWRHFQFRNGRQKGEWDIAWDEMSDEIKEYDRNAVRAIPAALRAIGIEIVRNVSPGTVKTR